MGAIKPRMRSIIKMAIKFSQKQKKKKKILKDGEDGSVSKAHKRED